MDKTAIKTLFENNYKRKLVLSINDLPLFNSFQQQFGDIFYSNMIDDTPFMDRVDSIIKELQQEYQFGIISPMYQVQLYAPNLISIKITVDIDEKYLNEQGIIEKFGWFFSR